jgi:hypothetical protein
MFFLDIYSIYVYAMIMKTKNQYPDWVEKFRTKGHTIRKVRDGYGLYKCTSVYVPGAKHPKSKQEYLGMITEADGFVPKKTVSEHPLFIEYGLSHLIWCSFRRELRRSTFNGDEILVKLGIIRYIFGSTETSVIELTFISNGLEEELKKSALSSSEIRLKKLVSKIDGLLDEKIKNPSDRRALESILLTCVMDSKNRENQIPELPEMAKKIIERYGLKYGQE